MDNKNETVPLPSAAELKLQEASLAKVKEESMVGESGDTNVAVSGGVNENTDNHNTCNTTTPKYESNVPTSNNSNDLGSSAITVSPQQQPNKSIMNGAKIQPSLKASLPIFPSIPNTAFELTPSSLHAPAVPLAATTTAANPASTNNNTAGQQSRVQYTDAAYLADPAPDLRRNRGGVTNPFPGKLHEMLDAVEREGLSHVVGWFSHGRGMHAMHCLVP